MGNTPNIRFKGFTDDWEQRKLGDTCKMNGRIGFRGYTEKDIISKEAGGVLTFSPTNIVENKLTIGVKNTYITRDKYEESPEIMVKNGNILFVKTGSTLGKSALVTGIEEDCTVNPQVVVIKVADDMQKILSVALTSVPVQKQITAVKIGGAVPTMTETELKNIDLVLPQSSDERIKIGEYFINLDELITLHQRKCDETKKLKKFMLQKMFPKNGEKKPEIRFEGFTDDWEQRKLGELGEIMTGCTPSTLKSEYYSEDGIPWVTPTDINAQIISDTPRKLSEEGMKVGRVVPANTILCTCIASIGKNTLLTVKGSFNQQINSLTPYVENDAYFLLTESELWSDKMKRMAASGTMQIVNKTEFSELTTMVPKTEEQKKIGEYFSNLDHLITLHQRKCDEIKEIKKFMLQNMFPQKG